MSVRILRSCSPDTKVQEQDIDKMIRINAT